MIYYASDNPNGFVTGKRFSVDKPFVTVMAAGAGGDSLGHWHVVDDGRNVVTAAKSEKPPYRVPLMGEINALPWNGYRAASTFAGCGGSSLGYRMAGFRVMYANEFVEAARLVYEANARDGTVVDGDDVRKVSAADFLKRAGVKEGDLDVLDGSPPCASFSTAGKRSEHWGKEKKYSDKVQRTDDLFFEFSRLVKGVRPRAFVAENVSGLVKGVAKGYFIEILAALKACGYAVEARLLDAQWLGVPQMRQRIIFIGVRDDIAARGILPTFPTPLAYRYSVRDAIPWIVNQGDNAGFGGGAMRPAVTPSPTIGTGPSSGNGRFPPSVVEVVHDAGRGRETNITDQPCPTVTVGGGLSGDRNSGHFKIVPGDRGNRRRREEGQPYDPDEPMTAVLADGARANSSQFMIEHANGFDGHKPYPSDGPMRTVQAGRPIGMIVEADSDISQFAIGDEADNLRPGETSDKYFSLKRAHPDRPSQAVVGNANAGVGSVIHPTEKRKFSIAELKRICAFPDDFVLLGTYSQQWERLGRAVPPVMMRSIAERVRDDILRKADQHVRTRRVVQPAAEKVRRRKQA